MLRSSGEVAKLYEAHAVMVVYSCEQRRGTIRHRASVDELTECKWTGPGVVTRDGEANSSGVKEEPRIALPAGIGSPILRTSVPLPYIPEGA